MFPKGIRYDADGIDLAVRHPIVYIGTVVIHVREKHAIRKGTAAS